MSERRGRKSTKAIPPWSQRIVEARERAGLNQTELAGRVGKSQQTITGYETGDTEPNLSIYKAIAKATDVSPAWLVFGDEYGGDSASGGEAVYIDKNDRLFAWTFHEAARLFAEQGLNADFAYMLSYTRKLMRTPENGANEAQAKEAIQRAIEVDRAEFRKGLDQVLKNRL